MLIKEFSKLLCCYETIAIFDWKGHGVIWLGLAKDIPLAYAQAEVRFVYSDDYYNKPALVIAV